MSRNFRRNGEAFPPCARECHLVGFVEGLYSPAVCIMTEHPFKFSTTEHRHHRCRGTCCTPSRPLTLCVPGEKLYGLIEVNVSSGCHGLVGGASLIAGQLALGASKRPWATEAADEASRELIRRAYGRKPRVSGRRQDTQPRSLSTPYLKAVPVVKDQVSHRKR